jgi:hypothetical protein
LICLVHVVPSGKSDKKYQGSAQELIIWERLSIDGKQRFFLKSISQTSLLCSARKAALFTAAGGRPISVRVSRELSQIPLEKC